MTGGVGSVATDVGRRAVARIDLQRAQFRERHGLDQPQRLLAVGRARRLPDGGGHGGPGDGQARRQAGADEDWLSAPPAI